jgi:chromosome segregation ATPase
MESKTPEQLADLSIQHLMSHTHGHKTDWSNVLDFINELKRQVETLHWFKQYRITASQLAAKEKECEELKVELKTDYELINAHRNRISQLSAEKENLRIDRNNYRNLWEELRDENARLRKNI